VDRSKVGACRADQHIRWDRPAQYDRSAREPGGPLAKIHVHSGSWLCDQSVVPNRLDHADHTQPPTGIDPSIIREVSNSFPQWILAGPVARRERAIDHSHIVSWPPVALVEYVPAQHLNAECVEVAAARNAVIGHAAGWSPAFDLEVAVPRQATERRVVHEADGCHARQSREIVEHALEIPAARFPLILIRILALRGGKPRGENILILESWILIQNLPKAADQ